MGFERVVEDFDCEHCGAHNTGDGYTNHCHRCLHSKHVDDSPGDRAVTCHGLMEPVGIDTKRGSYVLVHRCVTCRAERRCRTSPQDSMSALHEVAKRIADAADVS